MRTVFYNSLEKHPYWVPKGSLPSVAAPIIFRNPGAMSHPGTGIQTLLMPLSHYQPMRGEHIISVSEQLKEPVYLSDKANGWASPEATFQVHSCLLHVKCFHNARHRSRKELWSACPRDGMCNMSLLKMNLNA